MAIRPGELYRFTAAVVCVCASVWSAPAGAQTPEERTAARALIAQQGEAVVTVLGSGKVRITQGGREMQNRDERIRAIATVLEPSGLAVMALSVLDPGDLMAGSLSRGRPAGAPQVTVTTEAADLRFRMSDGREIPVQVVLRDKDLDLAFLRPIEPPAKPMTEVSRTTSKASAIDPVIVLTRLFEVANWQVSASFASVTAVVEKPRTYYLLNGGGFGAPVFDAQGRFVGIVVRLRSDDDQGTAGAPPVVLPADDVREVAKQAK
jgi:hypothetical protein